MLYICHYWRTVGQLSDASHLPDDLHTMAGTNPELAGGEELCINAARPCSSTVTDICYLALSLCCKIYTVRSVISYQTAIFYSQPM